MLTTAPKFEPFDLYCGAVQAYRKGSVRHAVFFADALFHLASKRPTGFLTARQWAITTEIRQAACERLGVDPDEPRTTMIPESREVPDKQLIEQQRSGAVETART